MTIRGCWRASGAVLGVALLAGGCMGGGKTGPVEDAVLRCTATALIGTAIGAAAGGQRGALIGAAVGSVGCAVLTALDEQDRARIRRAQVLAASTNRTQYLVYVGADRRRREITVRPKPALAEAGRVCRQSDGDVAVEGAGSVAVSGGLICRGPNGTWGPA